MILKLNSSYILINSMTKDTHFVEKKYFDDFLRK